MEQSKKALGNEGENLAAGYFKKKGYKILDRGFYCRYGEIDIIAQKGKTIVFVEVKLRKNSGFAAAMEQVGPQKQERIRKTAMLWIQQHDQNFDYRFDVVEVYRESGQLNHIENAF